MALVRCPSCGRVADGTVCFACGHEWSDAPAPAPAPAAVKPPSVKFETASPTSFPVAAPIAPAVVAPSPPPFAPPALPADPISNSSDEIELDMEFDGEGLAVVGGSLVDGPPELSSFPGGELPSFSLPPAFGGPPAPGSNSFAPPPAFGGTPAFGTPGAFSEASPSRSFGKATPSASQSFGPTIAATAPPVVNPWGTPGPLSSPPSARAASSAFGALPQSPSLHSSTLASLDAPPPSAPSTGSWGSNPTLVVSSEEQQAYAAAAMAALSQPPPAPEGAAASWASNPTLAISSAEALAAVAPPRATAEAPASLSGLFDGIDGKVVPAPAPAPARDPAPVTSATDEVGDIFNFSLEPGSTVEPAPDATHLSPFAADAALGDLVHERPARPTEIPQELPSHMPSSPPPGAAMGSDDGSFAEIALDSPIEESFDIEDDHGDDLSAGPPLADFSPGPAMADFSLPADEAPAGPPEPAFPELPAPPLMDFGSPAFGGAPALPDVDVDVDEALPAPPPLSTFTAATREPFNGLAMTIEPGPVDELPAPPQMDFGHAPAPADASAVAASVVDEASFADMSFGDLAVDHQLDVVADPGIPDIPVDDFDPDQALADLGEPLAAAAAAPPTGPTLSSRVGLLAENLEEAGRFADAALLYEVQATLSTLGR